MDFDNDALKSVTPEQAWHYSVVPKRLVNGVLELYTVHANRDMRIEQELEVILGTKVKLSFEDDDKLRETLHKHYRRTAVSQSADAHLRPDEDFLLKVISEARGFDSSDIHVEIYEDHCRVRFRIDGRLTERHRIGKTEYPYLINKIKIRAGLDISEKRLPQDGRVLLELAGRKIELRVSTLPTLYGEKVVLRILNKDASKLRIDNLGMSKTDLTHYETAVRKTNGIVLISGPTGSGKTTTLYATLKVLNRENVNVLSIEDPVEYTLAGINQVQVKEGIGLGFAQTLRAFLRQDPDIIMVGEIRDRETAEIAVRAAMTGHLVLSTIHTNSAWGTVTRLMDMGVPGYLLANTLNACVAQRLVRLLCTHCKIKRGAADARDVFGSDYKGEFHFVPGGCDKCYYSGFAGRIAVYEVVVIDRYLMEKIRGQDLDVAQYLKQKNFSTLHDNALRLVGEGLTSLEEVHPLIHDHA